MQATAVANLAAGAARARSGLHVVTRLVRQGVEPPVLARIADELVGVQLALSPLASRAARPAMGAGGTYAADASRAVALLEQSVRAGIAPPPRDVAGLLARVDLLAAHVGTLG